MLSHHYESSLKIQKEKKKIYIYIKNKGKEKQRLGEIKGGCACPAKTAINVENRLI